MKETQQGEMTAPLTDEELKFATKQHVDLPSFCFNTVAAAMDITRTDSGTYSGTVSNEDDDMDYMAPMLKSEWVLDLTFTEAFALWIVASSKNGDGRRMDFPLSHRVLEQNIKLAYEVQKRLNLHCLP